MMSKDEALKEWLDINVPELPASSKIPSPDRAVAREAWHAAVKHTLEHVASSLSKDVQQFKGMEDRTKLNYLRLLQADILQMKP